MTTFNIKTCDNRDITIAACHYGSHVVYIDTSDDRLAKKFTNRAPGEMDACFGFISELGQAGFSVILYNIQRDSESSEWMHVSLCNTGKPETTLETEIDVYLITGLKNMVRRFVDPLRVDVKGGMISAILSQDCLNMLKREFSHKRHFAFAQPTLDGNCELAFVDLTALSTLDVSKTLGLLKGKTDALSARVINMAFGIFIGAQKNKPDCIMFKPG